MPVSGDRGLENFLMNKSSNNISSYRLYVASQTLTTPRTIDSVRYALTALLGQAGYELEVIDVISNPGAALEGKVKATPTLVRLHPLPEVRIIGDMGRPDLLGQVVGDFGRLQSRTSVSGD